MVCVVRKSHLSVLASCVQPVGSLASKHQTAKARRPDSPLLASSSPTGSAWPNTARAAPGCLVISALKSAILAAALGKMNELSNPKCTAPRLQTANGFGGLPDSTSTLGLSHFSFASGCSATTWYWSLVPAGTDFLGEMSLPDALARPSTTLPENDNDWSSHLGAPPAGSGMVQNRRKVACPDAGPEVLLASTDISKGWSTTRSSGGVVILQFPSATDFVCSSAGVGSGLSSRHSLR